jgi:hypothetical protein
MVNNINGNCVTINVKQNELIFETPIIVDKIDVAGYVLELTDCVTSDKCIGLYDKERQKVVYIDISKKQVFEHVGYSDVVGLVAYKDNLFVIRNSAIDVIKRAMKVSKSYVGRNFIGVVLYNPFSVVFLEYVDVPTVQFYSLQELLELSDLIPTTFMSMYIPSSFYDYHNLLVKDGLIWVRGQNGLVGLSLQLVGSAGILFNIEAFYNSFREVFKDKQLDRWHFRKCYNHKVFMFSHEETGRFMFLIDDDMYLGDLAIFVDREWFFDVSEKVFYRYRFTDEPMTYYYDKCYVNLLFDFDYLQRFQGFYYDVKKCRENNIMFNVIANYRGEERSLAFNLPLDEHNFRCNLYGEEFSLVWYLPVATKMKIAKLNFEDVKSKKKKSLKMRQINYLEYELED